MLAQGAVMAIEDAVILGRCFDKYGDVATALARYQDARIEVTSRKVAGANDNAVRFHNPALATEDGRHRLCRSRMEPRRHHPALRMDLHL